MPHAQAERRFACAALLAVGPSAPTLCTGWDAHDLAVHLWLRENDPVAALGIRLPALAAHTAARMASLKRSRPFEEVVERVRQGPPTLSVYGLPGCDEAMNALEYLVHGMDVRRANGLPEPVRGPGFEDWAWDRLRRLAPWFFRRVGLGVVLERAATGQRAQVSPGSRIVTVVGAPSELVLYAFGRRAAAAVETVGEPESVALLATARLGG